MMGNQINNKRKKRETNEENIKENHQEDRNNPLLRR